MPTEETVSGRQKGWSLIKKLGEGDAGEVFLVESILEKKLAILKRPRRTAFTSDILRQATQIENEGKILQALADLNLSNTMVRFTTPVLIDQAPTNAQYSDRYFIIISQAAGYNLATLARLTHLGDTAADQQPPDDDPLLQTIVQQGQIPELLILRALLAVLGLFEKIHSTPVKVDGIAQAGILWNDVKPDHIYWDADNTQFTIIDWGNSQFLEEDGTTKDRRYSRKEDYAQFFQAMANFLANHAPDLHQRLDWPLENSTGLVSLDQITAFKERLISNLQEAQGTLRSLRQQEYDLLQFANAEYVNFIEIIEVQSQIMAEGEKPDQAGLQRFSLELAHTLARESRLEEFQTLCNQLHQYPFYAPGKWHILNQVANLGIKYTGSSQAFSQAIIAALNDDWPTALWELLLTTQQSTTEPDWWETISEQIRSMQPEVDPKAPTPYTVLNRLALTLEAESRREVVAPGDQGNSNGHLERYQQLAKILREEIIRTWSLLEPDPPYASLLYDDLDNYLEEIGDLRPESRLAILRALSQPKAQVKLVLDAWEHRNFDTARHGLRRVLFWDPDRRRVWEAERAILSAPGWLARIENGPGNEESLHDFVTEVEWRGRELRNHVGPATWLDRYLELLTQLRKGNWPSDLIITYPELRSNLPWLNEFEPGQQPVVLVNEPIRLEREVTSTSPVFSLQGILPGVLGQEQDIYLTEPLDTWAPEARGSSARVFTGFLRNPSGNLRQAAIKLMRPNHIDYALPLFREEVQVLLMMQDVPGVNPMLEFGYVKLDPGLTLPPENSPATARFLSGTLARYGADQALNYIESLAEQTEQGWLPYLALEKREWQDNLMQLCDVGHTHGRFLPLPEALRICIQILAILEVAHARNIIYRDHKILHYYWIELFNGVLMIDWNIAKRYPQGLSNSDRQFDLVQFGARAMHHILTGRPAPGSLPLGPNRPEDIETAAHFYRAQWTYDDQRLPVSIREITEQVLAGGYTQAGQLRLDLLDVYQHIVHANGLQSPTTETNLV